MTNKSALLELASREPSDATKRMAKILGAKWVWKDCWALAKEKGE